MPNQIYYASGVAVEEVAGVVVRARGCCYENGPSPGQNLALTVLYLALTVLYLALTVLHMT